MEDSHSSNPTDAVIFVGISLAMGVACRHLFHGTRVPYTIALLFLGMSLGFLEYGTGLQLGKIGDGIRIWANIDPNLLLAVFLPALLFESSFSMDVHQIKRCMVQMLLVAGPGVIISTFCIGSAVKLTFPYNWSWGTSLLLGALLSATDPVAVVALLKELGTSKKMSTIIEGESLMNDGASIVVYQLFYQMVLGQSFSWGSIVKFLTLASVGAVGIGVAFGVASVFWLKFIFNDTIMDLSLTLAVSYIAYFIAQEGADVSGILTVMTLGIFLAAVGGTAFRCGGRRNLHHFWEVIAYLANILIFILSGVVIVEGTLHTGGLSELHGNIWGYLFLLYVFVQVARIIVVVTLYPFLRFFGYGLDWKEAIILVWSGLRGAVSLSLSLSVKRASNHSSNSITPEMGILFVFFTCGTVLFTLIVNGSTAQFLLSLFGMDGLSQTENCILEFTKQKLMKETREAYRDLGDDDLGTPDWPTVKSYMTCLSNFEWEEVHSYRVCTNDNFLEPMNLKVLRVCLLKAAQAAYWKMLDEGRITQTITNDLMKSVHEAIDLVSQETLCDWKVLKARINFPKYYKIFQTGICPQKLVRYFTVESLQYSCYICYAFLHAHRIARRQLHEFFGDNDITSIVINENNTQGEEARNYLEDLRVTFPQVLRTVKTRQVTYSMLRNLSDQIQNLENDGLLEERVVLHLRHLVQTDLKKLVRNPPLVDIPKMRDVIRLHPFLGTLPSMIQEALEGFMKEIIIPRLMPLYNEGTEPNYIYIIANGLVKCEGKRLTNIHSPHPTFSQGSILGIYEVLIRKPYICDMVTESVVLCYYIEINNFLSVLRLIPGLEDLFWQESALVIAKVLLPQVFENMSVQQARAFSADRLIMNTCTAGETVEIPNNSTGYLLEGSLRNQDTVGELLEAPSAFFSSYGDLDLFTPETSGFAASSCHFGSRYQVVVKARIVFLDNSALEAQGAF